MFVLQLGCSDVKMSSRSLKHHCWLHMQLLVDHTQPAVVRGETGPTFNQRGHQNIAFQPGDKLLFHIRDIHNCAF